jgi:hypothetical protein
MSQRSSITHRITRSQSAQGAELTPQVDNPDRQPQEGSRPTVIEPSAPQENPRSSSDDPIGRLFIETQRRAALGLASTSAQPNSPWEESRPNSGQGTPLERLRTQIRQMAQEGQAALEESAAPDLEEEEPTIIVGEGNRPNETAQTEADIIGGEAIPRITTPRIVIDPSPEHESERSVLVTQPNTPEEPGTTTHWRNRRQYTHHGRAGPSNRPTTVETESEAEEGIPAPPDWARRGFASETAYQNWITERRAAHNRARADYRAMLDPVPAYHEVAPIRTRENAHEFEAHRLTGIRRYTPQPRAIEAPQPILPAQPPAPQEPEPAPVEPEEEAPDVANMTLAEVREVANRDRDLAVVLRFMDMLAQEIDERQQQRNRNLEENLQNTVHRQEDRLLALEGKVGTMEVNIRTILVQTGMIADDIPNNLDFRNKAIQNFTLLNTEQVKIRDNLATSAQALRAMGKEVSNALNKLKDDLQTDIGAMQETIQALEERDSERDEKESQRTSDKITEWKPEAESSRRNAGIFGNGPGGPPSGPPSREGSPDPHNRRPKKDKGKATEEKHETPKSAKTKKPDAFNGKRGPEAEVFMMKMEVYFQDYESHFTDERKITTFLTNMGEGEASKWARPLLRKMLDKEEHEYLRNWRTLRNAFLLSFSDPMKKERALRDIQNLKQVGSAQSYAVSFRTMKEHLDWDEKALIDLFKKGLKLEVQTELLKATITQDTDNFSLEDWIRVATKLDDLLFTSRNLGTKDHAANKPTWNKKTQGKASQEPTIGKTGRVPTEIIRERKQAGACLKCGRKGHMIAKCTDKEWYHGRREYETRGKEAKIEELSDEESTSSESEN